MVLKKQTVWLLTMLSLVAVLGVYFLTPGGPSSYEASVVDEDDALDDFEGELWEQFLEENPDSAVVVEEWDEKDGEAREEEDAEEDEEEEPVEEELNEEVEVAADASSEEWFAAMRIQREENRSQVREDYTNTLASSEASVEEKNEAHEQREQLQTLDEKESTLEHLIQAQGYDEVIVMAEDEEVRILVQAEELSKTEVIEINRLANEQLGSRQVAVGYHYSE